MTRFSDYDKARCAQREVRYRLKVYPGLIRADKMTQEMASREIELMREIANDYMQRDSEAMRAAARPEQEIDFT
jgi:hypothetical protein